MTICPICLEDEPNMTLNCNHQFHKHCVDTWIIMGGPSCPMCRAAIIGHNIGATCESPYRVLRRVVFQIIAPFCIGSVTGYMLRSLWNATESSIDI